MFTRRDTWSDEKLLEHVRAKAPEGWFSAREIRELIVTLERLRKAGYLDARHARGLVYYRFPVTREDT